MQSICFPPPPKKRKKNIWSFFTCCAHTRMRVRFLHYLHLNWIIKTSIGSWWPAYRHTVIVECWFSRCWWNIMYFFLSFGSKCTFSWQWRCVLKTLSKNCVHCPCIKTVSVQYCVDSRQKYVFATHIWAMEPELGTGTRNQNTDTVELCYTGTSIVIRE